VSKAQHAVLMSSTTAHSRFTHALLTLYLLALLQVTSSKIARIVCSQGAYLRFTCALLALYLCFTDALLVCFTDALLMLDLCITSCAILMLYVIYLCFTCALLAIELLSCKLVLYLCFTCAAPLLFLHTYALLVLY
jgi:hypothetical protein